MSITNVSIKAKQVILLRLLNDGESLIDASSNLDYASKLQKNI